MLTFTHNKNLTIDIDHVKYITSTGYECYDSKGRFHNNEGPAIVTNDGEEQWWYHGKLHRIDGPALTINAHQLPTIIFVKKILLKLNQIFKTKFKVELNPKNYIWYKHGKKHREDGPAVDVQYNKEYYLDDIKYSYHEWLKRVKLMCFK